MSPRELARRLTAAVLAPMLWSLRSGYVWSAALGRGVDARGRPIPGYALPATDFLARRDFTSQRVLEWGSGNSTLWWARRAKEVTAFEDHPGWHRYVARRATANTHLRFLDRLPTPADVVGVYDVIVIDGLDGLRCRPRCAELSLPHLSEEGVVIVDDYPSTRGPHGETPIPDMLTHAGFVHVEFWGPAPGVVHPQCTAIYFRSTRSIIFAPSQCTIPRGW